MNAITRQPRALLSNKEGKTLGMTSAAMLILLGERTLDIHLNADAMWTNVPTKVWAYTLGGYQVIKSGCPTAKRKSWVGCSKPKKLPTCQKWSDASPLSCSSVPCWTQAMKPLCRMLLLGETDGLKLAKAGHRPFTCAALRAGIMSEWVKLRWRLERTPR